MLKKKEEKNSLKVGILLPQSKEYPEIARHFLDGIKLYFTLHPNEFPLGEAELVVEDVGFGTERASQEKVRKLITQDDVVILGGLLQFDTAKYVGITSELADVPTLIAGMGESSIPREELPENLFFHSLHLWQSTYLLGLKSNAREVVVITSLFDTGYDPHRAFRLGLSASGGEILQEFTLKAYDENELINEVKNNIQFRDDVTYALLLHPKLLTYFIANFGDQIKNMISFPFYEGVQQSTKNWAFVNWRQEELPSYQLFAKGVADFLETPITVFHCLGYVHGQMLYKALQQCEGNENEWKSVMETWKSFSDDTILGIPVQNDISPTVNFPISFFEGQSFAAARVPTEVLTEYHFVEEDAEDMTLIRNLFTNPYLFF